MDYKSYFHADLPDLFPLVISSTNHNDILYSDKLCSIMCCNNVIEHLDKDVDPSFVTGKGKLDRVYLDQYICYNVTEYCVNYFGLFHLFLLIQYLYPRYKEKVNLLLEQAAAFNPYLCNLFIQQALYRLSYLVYDLDYETYRNKENIKTRSVIEDFYDIFGKTFLLPRITEDMKSEGWWNYKSDIPKFPDYILYPMDLITDYSETTVVLVKNNKYALYHS